VRILGPTKVSPSLSCAAWWHEGVGHRLGRNEYGVHRYVEIKYICADSFGEKSHA